MNLNDSAKHCHLRLVEESDAEFIVQLRGSSSGDNGANKFLNAIDDDIESQKKWIREYKKREQQGTEYYCVVCDEDGTDLGLFRLYNISTNSFTPGSWIFKHDAPTYSSIESALLCFEMGFYTLGAKEGVFDVHKDNQKIIDFHLRNGAVQTGSDEQVCYFSYTQQAHEDVFRKKYKKYYSDSFKQKNS